MEYCICKQTIKGKKSMKAKSSGNSKRKGKSSARLCMGRMPFSKDVSAKLKLKKGQARCHTISWETISKNIIELSELFLNDKIDGQAYWIDMITLWYAVTLKPRPSVEYLKNISSFLYGEGDREELLNIIGSELNSCISNLRPGFSRTNSSIQGGLDIPISAIQIAALPKDTLYTTEWPDLQNESVKVSKLEQKEQVLLITGSFIIRLKALLSIHTSVEPYIYTTGNQVQSSDYPNMNKGNTLPPGCRIGFQIKDGLYYLFSKEEG